MKLQILQDSKGHDTGVFIPIAEWEYIKKCYPNIEELRNELPHWQQDTLDKRLDEIKTKPENLRPISHLFEILDQEEG
jgi:hypothetical protein